MSDVWLPLFLRCLPAIAVLVLGFLAANDRRTREQWTTMLYQAGSLKPDQRDDPKIQSRVSIPFFIVAALLLIWPVKYYFWATRIIEIGEGSDLFQKQTPRIENAPDAGSNKIGNSANSANTNNAANATNTSNNANTAPPATPANPNQPHL